MSSGNSEIGLYMNGLGDSDDCERLIRSRTAKQ